MIIHDIDSGYESKKLRAKAAQLERQQQAANSREVSSGLKSLTSSTSSGGSKGGKSGAGSSRPRSATATIAYLAESKDHDPDHAPELLYSQNIDMVELAGEQMQTTASYNKRIEDPIMHTVISWSEGEQPTKEQMKECVEYYLEQAGYKEHEAIAYYHTHNGLHHVQICYNRVHPETHRGVDRSFTANKENYLIHERVARELEIKHDFVRGADIHHRIEKLPDGTEKVIQLSKSESIERQQEYRQQAKLGRAAIKMERSTGLPSFDRYVKEHGDIKAIDREVKQLIKDNPNPSWQDIHKILDKYDLEIKPVKSGLVIVDKKNPDICVTKASAVSRQLSAGSLSKTIKREYEPPAINRKPEQGKGYSAELQKAKDHNPLYQEYAAQKASYKMSVDRLDYNSVKNQIDTIKQSYEVKIATVRKEANDMRKGYYKEIDGKMQFVKPNVNKQVAELRAECKRECAEVSKEFKQQKAELDKSPAAGSYREYLHTLDKSRPEVAKEIQRVEKSPVTVLIDKRAEISREIDNKQEKVATLYEQKQELVKESLEQGTVMNIVKGTDRKIERIDSTIKVEKQGIDQLKTERQQVNEKIMQHDKPRESMAIDRQIDEVKKAKEQVQAEYNKCPSSDKERMQQLRTHSLDLSNKLTDLKQQKAGMELDGIKARQEQLKGRELTPAESKEVKQLEKREIEISTKNNIPLRPELAQKIEKDLPPM